MPTISVIIANYNKGQFIEETIESILAQDLKDFEVLIIDDCSTDDSSKKLGEFAARDPRIKFYKNEENKGANFCRNFGIRKSAGQYLLFMDADDLLSKNCLQSRAQAFSDFPESDVVVASMGVFNRKAGDTRLRWIPGSKDPLSDFLMHNLPWSIMQPLWRRELPLLHGFDENFNRLQDVEFHTRILLDISLKVHYLHTIDCFYRIEPSRHNYSAIYFLTRWVESARDYCDKFYLLVGSHKKLLLIGTVFQTYISILSYRKRKIISSSEMFQLEQLLFKTHVYLEKLPQVDLLFRFAKLYNLYFIRVPGINRLCKAILLNYLIR